MGKNERSGLKRLDDESMLPVGFSKLSDEEKRNVIQRIVDQDIELRAELGRKRISSNIAENDLAVAIDLVQRLESERRIYSHHSKGETGSGSYDLKIRGGDTKFIVPILLVVGIIIVALVLVLSL